MANSASAYYVTIELMKKTNSATFYRCNNKQTIDNGIGSKSLQKELMVIKLRLKHKNNKVFD